MTESERKTKILSILRSTLRIERGSNGFTEYTQISGLIDCTEAISKVMNEEQDRILDIVNDVLDLGDTLKYNEIRDRIKKAESDE